MAYQRKGWREKRDTTKKSQKKRIEKAFAGMPAGAMMYISTPLEIDGCVKKIRRGEIMSPQKIRGDLAVRNQADYTCPVSTGIFLRIVAESAYEELMEGAPTEAVAPFWRAIDPKSPLAAKLTCGPEFIREKRAAEGIENEV